MTVQSAIQEIVLKHRRRYGYRRVTAELRRRGDDGEPQTSGANDAGRQLIKDSGP
jgi:hypothetical protein